MVYHGHPTSFPPTSPSIMRSLSNRALFHALVPMSLALLAAAVRAQLPQPKQRPAAAEKAPPAPASTLATPGTPSLTAQDVSAFLDGVLPLQLQREDIAGAVVLVVQDGKVLFSRGYGFSDVKNRKPVTVDATLFRIGSISKTFTWTAVMQLVEQGKIDLDRDVNEYLDFKIPAAFGKPITMRDILTHTTGFEESLKDLFVPDSSYVVPLKDYLPRHLPRRIFPPGTTPAYSNYGATLAGYIVERVSGTPFDDYIDKNILQPLGMTRTTFAQPLPKDLVPFMSNGYAKASGTAKPFEVVQAWPAGSVAATAENMSRFMVAHLQDGEYNAAHILQPATAKQMHSRLFGLSPSMNAMAYGFYEETRNGHRVIGHGGDTQWFHSDMHLLPDDHLGFFISYNSAGKGEISPRTAVWEAFLDRYFPYTPPTVPALASAAQDLHTVEGSYITSRREQGSILTPLGIVGQQKVKVNSDGTLSAGLKDLAGNEKHFQEVGPLQFREVNGQDRVAFVKDANGRLVLLLDYPFMVGQRTPALKSSTFNIVALASGVCLFALTLLFWPVNAILRRHYNHRLSLTPEYRRWRGLVRLTAALNLVFVGFWVKAISSVQNDIGTFTTSRDGQFHAIQVLGLFGLLGLPIAGYLAWRSWGDRNLWIWTKIWNTLLALGFAGYTFFVLNGRMFDFTLRY